MAVCDFDMRFTFVIAGWLRSVHDMRAFKDAMTEYGDKFPHPPKGTGMSLLSQSFNPLYVTRKENVCMEFLSCELGYPN